MQVFVLSLKDANDRRLFMSDNLRKLNIPFDFFNAIKGEDKMYSQVNYNHKKRWMLAKRDLSLGELGCYFSHCELWKKCIELNQAICVLEDDVKVSDDFLSVLSQFEDANKYSFGLLRLGSVYDKSHYLIKEQELIFRVPFKQSTGTIGYIVKPEAAKKLLSFATKEIYLPIDTLIDLEYLHKVNVFAIAPFIVFEQNTIFSSQIQAISNKEALSFIYKLNREYYRLIGDIKRSFYVYMRFLKDKYLLKKVIAIEFDSTKNNK